MKFRLFIFCCYCLLLGSSLRLWTQEVPINQYTPSNEDIEKIIQQQHELRSRFTGDLVGTPAPQFSAQSMDGQEFGPKELLGKVIVLNFWFINCPPCKLEKPILNEVVQMYAKDDRVVFLSICKDEDIAAIRNFLESQPINMPVIAGGTSLIELFDVGIYPMTLVIDRRGRYSGGIISSIQKETLHKQIQHALLGKKPDPKNMINPLLGSLKNDLIDKAYTTSDETPMLLAGTNDKGTEQAADDVVLPQGLQGIFEDPNGAVEQISINEMDFRDEEGNSVGFFEMLGMTDSGEYIQEHKTDPEGKSFIQLRKATPAETAQIRKQNRELYKNSSPIIKQINESFDQELTKNFPTATPNIPIRIKAGPQISFADYQQKMKSGAWMEEGILSPEGILTGIEIQRKTDGGKLSDQSEGLLNDLSSVIGNSVTAFELTDMDGNMIRSQDTSGKVLVFNFWFTSCKPCISEFPALNSVYQRYKKDPRVVFAAVTFESREKIEAFIERGKYPLDFPIVPENTQFLKQFKNPGAPGNVVVGTDGKILYNGCGTNKLLVEEQLCSAIDNALAQKDPQIHGQISLHSQLFTLQQWADYLQQNPLTKQSL